MRGADAPPPGPSGEDMGGAGAGARRAERRARTAPLGPTYKVTGEGSYARAYTQ